MTIAKIGRSIKNLAMCELPLIARQTALRLARAHGYGVPAVSGEPMAAGPARVAAEGRGRPGRRGVQRRFSLNVYRVNEHTRRRPLNAGDNDLLACIEAAVHDPVRIECACGLDRPLSDFVIRSDNKCRCLSLRVVGHGDLRHEQRVVVHAFFDTRAHEHAGQQNVIGFRTIARTVTDPVFWSTVMSVNCNEPAIG